MERAWRAGQRRTHCPRKGGCLSQRESDRSDAPATVTHRTCPGCGQRGFSVLITHPPWRLVQCTDCALAYLPEVPTAAQIEGEFEWQASFARERWQRWQHNPLTRLYTFALMLLKPSRAGRALRRIRRRAPAGRLLDVGCGDGRLAALALRAGYDALGIELSPRMAAKAAGRLGRERVLVGRLEDAALPPASFDVVTAISYLEHDPQPAALLARLHALLRPGGALFIKVPNYASLLRRLRGARWSGYRWPEHVQYFTPQTLTGLVRAAGFEVCEVRAHPLGDNLWLAARR